MNNNEFRLEQVSVRLSPESPLYSDEKIRTPQDAVKIVGRELMTEFDREQILVINLNSNGQPINFSICSIGTINNASISPRELLKSSILSNAASAIVLHNHPSGSLNPSKSDLDTTKRLIESYSLIGINLLDHIIIGGNNADKIYSMREEKIIDFDDYRFNLSGGIQFESVAELITEKIGVFLVAEDLSYWVNTNYSTIYLTNEEAELILEYADIDGYNLGVRDGEFVKIDENSEEIEKYSPEEAIYKTCDINEELIRSLELKVKNATNFVSMCNAKQELAKAKNDENIVNEMFKKTALGKMMELGTTSKEKTKERNKEWTK